MKKFITLLAFFATTFSLYAQVPQAICYQAVATDTRGNELVSQSIKVRLSILKTSSTGPEEWVETHSVTTDGFGLFDLTIGSGTRTGGTQTVFSGIKWGADKYYLKVEMDVTGGTNYVLMGTNQMVSVPYALYADKAGAAVYADSAKYAIRADSAAKAYYAYTSKYTDSSRVSLTAITAVTALTAKSADTTKFAWLSDSTRRAGTATTAITAITANTANYAITAGTARRSDTATFAWLSDSTRRAGIATTAITALTANYATTAGTARRSDTATFAWLSDSTRRAGIATTAITAITANTANYATTAGTARRSDTATFAWLSDSTRRAGIATTAITAITANTANYAITAGTARRSDTATFAWLSDSTRRAGIANVALTANYATTAGTARRSDTATFAWLADSSRRANTAIRANVADSASRAAIAHKATLADSSNRAFSAVRAIVADSANRAFSAVRATVADSASRAATAVNANFATKAASANTALDDNDKDPTNEIQTMTYDTITSTLKLSKPNGQSDLVSFNSTPLRSPGASIDYPFGILGEALLIMNNYTVPAGKTLFVSAVNNPIEMADGKILNIEPGMPIIPSGQTISSCFCSGILVDNQPYANPIILDFSSSLFEYTVPTGKYLVVKSGTNGSRNMSFLIDGTNFDFFTGSSSSARLVVIPAGKKMRKGLTNVGSFIVTGYLLQK